MKNRESLWRRLQSFATEPDHAVNLAATRIVFFGTTLYLAPWREADRWAALPEELLVAPDGTQWLADLGLLDPGIVRVLIVVLTGVTPEYAAWSFVAIAGLVSASWHLDAWPVATYPIFPRLESSETEVVEVVLVDEDGIERDLFENTNVLEWMPEHKLYRLLLANATDDSRAAALSNLVACELNEPFVELAIHSTVVSSEVGQWDIPIRREQTFSFRPGDSQRASPPRALAFHECR